jgi:hypothetical protein
MSTNPPLLRDLTGSDPVAWYDATIELLDLGRHDALDFTRVRGLLTDMGASERREVKNRLVVLLAHVLKWTHQPDKRSRSWSATIYTQQRELADHAAGVLREHARRVTADAYPLAVGRATRGTGLPAETFPADCPYTFDQLLAFDPGDVP